MASESTQVYSAALSMPEGDRADLAYRLLQSLKAPAVLSEDDQGFDDELERRARAYETGETSASDWDNVSARLRKALEDKRSK